MALTLRYLASGDCIKTIACDFRIGPSTASGIVIAVSIGLFSVLKPCTPEEWETKATEFYNRWDFPNCVGAIDGKHISIQCPPKYRLAKL